MNKQHVLNHFGSIGSIAEFLGISQAAVSKWPVIIPELQALRLERLTKGKLVCDDRLYNRSVH
jgi:hypothetical protein